MGHLIIQNLDDAVLDSLRTRAAGLHKSVEETAAEILGDACGAPKMLTPAERFQLILKDNTNPQIVQRRFQLLVNKQKY